MDYALYLESGPQKKSTLVHVPALLGCVFQRPTTEAALQAAPDEIARFLRFLEQLGEPYAGGAEISTHVAAHDLSGGFLGTAPLETDFEPVSREECERLISRFESLRRDTFALVAGLSLAELAAKPAKGRPIERILSHILGGDYSNITSGLGLRIEGLHAIYAAADKGNRGALGALQEATPIVIGRLRAMTDEELTAWRERSTGPWSARRGFRVLLEHNWEHFREIEVRLGAG